MFKRVILHFAFLLALMVTSTYLAHAQKATGSPLDTSGHVIILSAEPADTLAFSETVTPQFYAPSYGFINYVKATDTDVRINGEMILNEKRYTDVPLPEQSSLTYYGRQHGNTTNGLASYNKKSYHPKVI